MLTDVLYKLLHTVLGLENNGHCLAAAFNLLTTYALPEGMTTSDVTQIQKDFISATMSLWWKLQDRRATGEELRNPDAPWVVIKHVCTLLHCVDVSECECVCLREIEREITQTWDP